MACREGGDRANTGTLLITLRSTARFRTGYLDYHGRPYGAVA